MASVGGTAPNGGAAPRANIFAPRARSWAAADCRNSARSPKVRDSTCKADSGAALHWTPGQAQ